MEQLGIVGKPAFKNDEIGREYFGRVYDKLAKVMEPDKYNIIRITKGKESEDVSWNVNAIEVKGSRKSIGSSFTLGGAISIARDNKLGIKGIYVEGDDTNYFYEVHPDVHEEDEKVKFIGFKNVDIQKLGKIYKDEPRQNTYTTMVEIEHTSGRKELMVYSRATKLAEQGKIEGYGVLDTGGGKFIVEKELTLIKYMHKLTKY